MSKHLSKREDAFIDRALSMRDSESHAFGEIGYWARVWVQASLPHSNPGKVNVWGRENGAFSLTVQPGVDIVGGKEKNYGIPFGSIPRLLMCWMCTEAVRTKERKLFLGPSLSEFIKSVGIGAATGGRWGSITRLKDQMERLFEARISYRWRGDKLRARKGIQVASEDVLWWSDEAPEQPTLFKSYVVLGDEFFTDIVTRPVPVKLEALRLLKRSPLALDLYTWATFRVFGLKKPVGISWSALQTQLGAEYTSTKEFARHCKATLRRVRAVYPERRLDFAPGRLVLKPSKTHVKALPRAPGRPKSCG